MGKHAEDRAAMLAREIRTLYLTMDALDAESTSRGMLLHCCLAEELVATLERENAELRKPTNQPSRDSESVHLDAAVNEKAMDMAGDTLAWIATHLLIGQTIGGKREDQEFNACVDRLAAFCLGALAIDAFLGDGPYKAQLYEAREALRKAGVLAS